MRAAEGGYSLSACWAGMLGLWGCSLPPAEINAPPLPACLGQTWRGQLKQSSVLSQAIV